MLKKLKNSAFVQFAASPKLTGICLLILIILTVWGTLYQTEHGLFAAKQKIFHSWIFLMFGIFPFPGTVLVLCTLFVNLIFALLFRIGFRFSNSGNILTHSGILIMLIGAFFTFFYANESVLSLREGEGDSFSIAYHKWELAIWEDKGQERYVYAIDSDNFKPGDTVQIDDLNISLIIETYYINCIAFLKDKAKKKDNVINSSGIGTLKGKTKKKEPAKNIAGVVLRANGGNGNKSKILLYGLDPEPTPLRLNNTDYYFSLRKKKYPLPFFLRLIDFKMIMYPGSEIVRSYESKVEMKTHGFTREVLISMNKPLRYKNLSIFQSSYYIAKNGIEVSTFTVVRNWGRWFPYISSMIIFFGLSIHFLMMLFKKTRKRTH